ncbi:MAG: hypothetical protein JXL97_02190 [Bacteroidales bacterium]|nr:hypothetical protein [Bacteroidales bacterium]
MQSETALIFSIIVISLNAQERHLKIVQNAAYKLAGINVNKASGNEDKALPVPATYIIGQDKKIFDGYFNTDYTIRMPVSRIVESLEKLNRQ